MNNAKKVLKYTAYDSIDLVREFHLKFRHPVQKAITIPKAKTRRLRILLIAEELAELAEVSGVPIEIRVGDNDNNEADTIVFQSTGKANYCDEQRVIGIADALTDLSVVVDGSFLTYGLPKTKLCEEVYRSNMSKLDEEGKPIYDNTGKIIKGPHFETPDIRKVLTGYYGELVVTKEPGESNSKTIKKEV